MGNVMRASLTLLSCLFGFALATATYAGDVKVAVAANFTAPMQEIATAFNRSTGNQVELSFGSTGTLYAQISNGAPFEVFLSADTATPKKLVDQKLALAGSAFTYASGKLVLWSPDPKRVDANGDVLQHLDKYRLAIANPKTAPYGAAAVQVLKKLRLYEGVKDRLIQGNNIAQTHQFVSSGNVDLGFVALSQVYRNGSITSGSAWLIPAADYDAIHQDAVLLKKGATNPTAEALLQFLQSPEAKKIIRSYGYQI